MTAFTSTISLPSLREGNTGEAVRFLQQILILRYGFSLPFNAVFGPETRNAVRLFQSNHGLIDDGMVGPKTWRELGAQIACPVPAAPADGLMSEDELN